MEKPRVGLSAIMRQGGKVLLGKRIGAHGEGAWAFPGGKLEPGEDFYSCLVREVFEETGMKVGLITKHPCAVTNDVFEEENQHWITLFYKTLHYSQVPKVMEPNKCKEWRWFDWQKMPSNLFLPVKNLVHRGYDPYREAQLEL